jgi:DNA cross-link repair 1A protein
MLELLDFQESSPNHEKEPCAGENFEIKRVIEWLKNLGLSKYEEIFIREEVDWETLQWLTEEVHSIVLFR